MPKTGVELQRWLKPSEEGKKRKASQVQPYPITSWSALVVQRLQPMNLNFTGKFLPLRVIVSCAYNHRVNPPLRAASFSRGWGVGHSLLFEKCRKTLVIRSYLRGPSSPCHVCLKHLNFLFPKFHGPDIQLLHKVWVLQMAEQRGIHHHVLCVAGTFCALFKGCGHCFLQRIALFHETCLLGVVSLSAPLISPSADPWTTSCSSKAFASF